MHSAVGHVAAIGYNPYSLSLYLGFGLPKPALSDGEVLLIAQPNVPQTLKNR